MFLLLCAVEKGYTKELISDSVSQIKCVESMLWFDGEDGKNKESRDYPVVIGGLRAMLSNESQDIMIAKIAGRENVDSVVKNIKGCASSQTKIECFVLPLVA